MTKGINVKLELFAYCDGYDYNFVDSSFSNIITDRSFETEVIKYICGVGKVLSCEDGLHGLFPGATVAFCGFTQNIIEKTVSIPLSCIIPVKEDISYEEVIEAGVLLPFITAFNTAGICLGENVMVVCEQKAKELTTSLLDLLGCVAIVFDGDTTAITNEFYNDLMAKTSGHGVDAVVIFHKEDDFRHIIPKHVCPDRTRITYANGIGVGCDDMSFMFAEKTYPVGYTGKTPKENLAFALSLLKKNETLSNVCKTLASLGHPVFFKEYENVIPTSEITGCQLTEGMLELKNAVKYRHEACLLQLSVRCPVIKDQVITTYESIAGSILGTASSSLQDVISSDAASRSIVFSDGSVAVINIAAGFKEEEIKIELHFEGKTLILENDVLRRYS